MSACTGVVDFDYVGFTKICVSELVNVFCEKEIVMRLIKKHLLDLAILGMIAINLSGCTYANNKNWDDLTAEEKEELQQEFESIKVELEEDLPSDSVEGKFTSYILDKVEEGIFREEICISGNRNCL